MVKTYLTQPFARNRLPVSVCPILLRFVSYESLNMSTPLRLLTRSTMNRVFAEGRGGGGGGSPPQKKTTSPVGSSRPGRSPPFNKTRLRPLSHPQLRLGLLHHELPQGLRPRSQRFAQIVSDSRKAKDSSVPNPPPFFPQHQSNKALEPT